MSISGGTRLGAYEIVGPLGAGGMGEVYRARDVKLHRDVAIKILPADIEADQGAIERLRREARAVAALNHPNVVTIYAVDESEGRLFLAMELVEGQTLADCIPRNGLAVHALLKYAIPLADALSAAHAQGITHRDLKPSNVMIANDGRMKVLDFGLAKVREDAAQFGSTAGPTQSITEQGQIVGTVAYMSPEQAAGGVIDHRSDLFSLGVLLYEMATGERPFKGDASVSVLASILKDEPRRISQIRPELPRDLERIVRRALAKDPEQRYQTAKDLRNDLQTLRDDLTSGELTASPAQPRAASRLVTWTAVAVALGASVLSAYLMYRARAAPPPGGDAMTITRLTTTGKASFAAVSPDGRYVVHVVSDNGYSLWVRQTKTGSDVRIVPPGVEPYAGLTFSRDGDFIYFTRFASRTIATLYRVPVLGGEPQQIIRDVDSPLALSSDGARYAFIRGVPSQNELRVLVGRMASADPPSVLAVRKLPDSFSLGSRLAWSPDDRTIIAPVGYVSSPGYDANTKNAMLVAIDVATGHERPLTARYWDYVSGIAWPRGSRTLLVAGSGRNKLASQIWRVDADTGTISRLTNDLNDYRDIDVAADASAAVTILRDLSSTLLTGAPADLRPATEGNGRSDAQDALAWTPDGKLIFSATANAQPDLWMADADGSSARPLTADPAVESHVCVPNGETVVYAATKNGRTGIWRQHLQSGQLTLLSDDPTDGIPVCSPDGTAVYFTRHGDELFRVGLDGGAPQLIASAKLFFGRLGDRGRRPVDSRGGARTWRLASRAAADRWRPAIPLLRHSQRAIRRAVESARRRADVHRVAAESSGLVEPAARGGPAVEAARSRRRAHLQLRVGRATGASRLRTANRRPTSSFFRELVNAPDWRNEQTDGCYFGPANTASELPTARPTGLSEDVLTSRA